MKHLFLTVALVAAATSSCKFEPIESLEFDRPTTARMPSLVVPWSLDSGQGDGDAAALDRTLRRYLGFLTSTDLKGRRPGTAGAGLTVGFVISELERSGLSPNGPDMGWTQPVGIRVVRTEDVSLTLRPGALPDARAPKPLRVNEGLWLHHRGAAGRQSLTLQVVAAQQQAEGTDDKTAAEPEGTEPLERMLVIPLPEADAEADADADAVEDAETNVSEATRVNNLFDDAWHEGMSVAVLPTPPEDSPTFPLAQDWHKAEIQALLPGRDPPAALDLHGFVPPSVHTALLDAAAIPGSVAEVEFEAVERWFRDDNVIGRIVGSRRPEQAVVVVAHWDAGGLTEPLAGGGGAVSAGALATLLAIAESSGRWQTAGRRPERSIVFVAEAGGSLGHHGIARFMEASGIRPENIVAVVNLERLGGSETDLTVIDGNKSTLGEEILQLNPGVFIVDDDGLDHGHVAFLERDIPAVTLTRPALPSEQEPEPTLAPATLRADTHLAFRLLWVLANETETPRLVVEDERAEP